MSKIIAISGATTRSIQSSKGEALPGVLGNRGTRAFISGEQGNKGQILRGTKTILGNREHRKSNFQYLGNRGTSQFISGEQGNRYPPWEGLKGGVTYTYRKGYKMCGYQRPLVCSLNTIFSIARWSQLILKIASKWRLSRAWCGLADWNSAIQLLHNVSSCTDHLCYSTSLYDV